MLDYIINGQGFGSVADRLLSADFDPGVLRPYIGKDGRAYVTRNVQGKPVAVVHNANATLRKDEWIHLDRAVTLAGRTRLRAVADLRAAGLTYSIPNGMGTTVLQTQNQSDPGVATVSMDGLRKGERDRPVFDITNLPLPITHSDFGFSAREIATARQSGSPLDVGGAEAASRRVAESIEQLTLGVSSTYAYGGGTIYGYANHPNRNTKSLTAPTTVGWTGATLVDEVLDMKQKSIDDKQYGPWRLYNAPAWDKYLDADYSTAKGDNTLRERLAKIEGIQGTQTADYLTGYALILVQQVASTARMVIGMDIVTLQWESEGGLYINFKVMGIQVPQIRIDFDGNSGIVHGS